MKRLTTAFTYIFADNEWFNKVLVGGFYFLLIPFGIGIIMLNGFLVAFVRKQKNGETEMPYWRNYKAVFSDGFRKSWLSLSLLVAIYATLISALVEFTIPTAILTLTCFLTINTIILTKSFDLFSLIASFVLLLAAISIGWMWIVVGWPLLIFLAVLVQIHMFTNQL